MFRSSLVQSEAFSEFTCVAESGNGEKGDLNWWNYSYSGFQWIDCSVKSEMVRISDIKINNGNCSIVDDWFIQKEFFKGDHIKLSHTCMDPVLLEVTSGGKTSIIKIK